jgi:hypothetical protein
MEGDVPVIDLLKRNMPCWCGSGKKYKKCHRIKDKTGYAGGEQAESYGLVYLGQSADAVLVAMPKKKMVRPPEVISNLPPGNFVVHWLYQGVTLRLERQKLDGVERYVVTRICIPGGSDGN